MNPDVIAIGDSTLDVFLTLNEKEAGLHCRAKDEDCEICFRYGSKIPVAGLNFSLGGNAPNVAVGLTRLGFKAGLVTIIGEDETARLVEERLRAANLILDYLKRETGNTSYSTIISYQSERTILEKKYHRRYSLPSNLPKTPFLYLSSLGPDYEEFFAAVSHFVQENKIKLGFNPAQPQLRSDFESYEVLVHSTHAIFLNREEAGQMLGSRGRVSAVSHQSSDGGDRRAEVKGMLRQIAELGPKYVVITDGRKGAWCFDGDKHYYCEIFPVTRVEATGAGDAFASGFLGALMHGKSAVEAMRWGMVNSASVVTKIGAVAGLLSKDEIESQLKGNPEFGPKEI